MLKTAGDWGVNGEACTVDFQINTAFKISEIRDGIDMMNVSVFIVRLLLVISHIVPTDAHGF